MSETAEIMADPEALRALADAQESVRQGDVIRGVDAVKALVRGRQAS